MLKVKFKTLGCRLNQYETQAIREQFAQAGYLETAQDQDADIFVLNTCTVTNESDRQSRYLIRKFHRENPQAKIVVTGCYVERNESEIKSIPGVSLTVLNRQKSDLLSLFESCTSYTLNQVGLPSRRQYTPLAISHFEGRSRAYIKVQDGCNHACSFCKVVLVRGPSRSRPLHEIVEEAKRLAGEGFKEIILTGIQLGAYGYDFQKRQMLTDVIEQLSQIDVLNRIRFSSIEPTDVSDELIDLMAANHKFCSQLHIPLQSGNDEVLTQMNRRYKRDFYLELIQKIKTKVSDFVLTTDVMVGFPGETHEQFDQTIDMLLRTEPYKLHIFPYSAREGTKAAKIADNISGPEKNRRREVLLSLEGKLRENVQRQFVRRNMDVLIEEIPCEDGWAAGRSSNYIKVHFKTKDSTPGRLAQVEIIDCKDEDLIGTEI